jgi:hypothetical protein
MPKHKIAIGLVTGNRMVHTCVPVSLLNMMSGRDWTDYEFSVIPRTSIYVDKNRNEVVWDFISESDADYLYFWDYDNGLFPEAFDIFMEDMTIPEVKIVTGLYYRKNLSSQSVAGLLREPDADGYTCDSFMFVGGGLINLTKFPGFCGAMVGAGSLMIKRELLEKMPYPWFNTTSHQCKDGRWTYSGEDVWFSQQVEKAGEDLYLDTRIRSPHYWNQYCFPGEWTQDGIDANKTSCAEEEGEEKNFLYQVENNFLKEK